MLAPISVDVAHLKKELRRRNLGGHEAPAHRRHQVMGW